MRVPEGWKVKTISNILDKVSRPVEVEEKGLYREIGIRSHGKGIFYKEPISGVQLGNKRVFHIEPNCLVINIVFAWEQAVAKTTDAEIGMIASHRFPMFVPKNDECDIDFIHHLFKTKHGKYLLELASPGGAGRNKTLGQSEFAKLELLLPPTVEQQKIAQILSTWDKAITTTEQLLANSQHQKKALMQQLLTGKKRLLDEDGVRFGEGWKEGNLGGITNIDSGYAFKSVDFTDSEAGVPIIRMSDFKTGGIDISGAAKIKMEATKGLDKFKLRAGDFVFGMSGSLSNYGWVKEQDLPCFLNQRVGRILVKEYSVQLFVTYLYLSDKIQQSILDKAAGAAQLNISVSDLRNTIVQYPNFEEQQKIAIVLSTADREIELLRTKLEALKQEKKALMQQLLTGKRRVKILEVG